MVHVNLSDVGGDFEVLPAGAYRATLIDVKFVEQDDPDKFPYFNCEFKLDDNPGKAWRILSLSPKAGFFLKEALEAFGEDPEVLNDEEGFDLDMEEYIGEEVILNLVIGTTDRGQERNEVENILPPDAAAPKETTRSKKSTKKAAPKRRRRKAV